MDFLSISDALVIGSCCKRLNNLVKNDTFWLKRIGLDFNVEYHCDRVNSAKNVNVLMHDVWDSDRSEFNVK